jgi:glycosyltransferase involved in cell wall biosynthesis
MTRRVDVSVVVPAHNAAQFVGEQLGALAAQDVDRTWVVVVVDDGSTDGLRAAVAAWSGRLPALRLTVLRRRCGASAARNCGAEAARGDLLLYCDADDVVAPGWLAAMAEAAEAADLVGGFVDGALLNGQDAARRRRPYPADRLPVLLDFLPYATSANFGIGAATLARLGGWNDAFWVGGDAELCWRAQLAGCSLAFVREAVVHYRHRASTWGAVRQQFAWGQADPLLHRDFRTAGCRRRSMPRIAGSLAKVVLTAPAVVTGVDRRSEWLRRTALLTGRAVGSARVRSLYL